MHFFRDGSVSAVLQSSGMTLYTAVVRAVLPCTHEKMTIFSRCPCVIIAICRDSWIFSGQWHRRRRRER